MRRSLRRRILCGGRLRAQKNFAFVTSQRDQNRNATASTGEGCIFSWQPTVADVMVRRILRSDPGSSVASARTASYRLHVVPFD
jgi:hypothetical protein